MICMALQPIRYCDKSYETDNLEQKHIFERLCSLQTGTKPFDTDRIQYLKNMIAYVRVA